MRRTGWRIGLGVVLLAWCGWMFLAETSSGTMDIQKKAKKLGFPAQNCLYCHNEKLPNKSAMTLNERGKWLVAEKDKRKPKEVDPAWLKDYTGDKK
jgi:hypothetical protein